MNSKKKKIAWTFQIAAAAILLIVGTLKFFNNPVDIFLFSTLDMEPSGRYLVGLLEIISGLLLLTEAFSAPGAFLGLGIMCGAIIAHTTVLGASVQGDKGQHLVLLAIVLISCLVVVYLRKKQLPIIGRTL